MIPRPPRRAALAAVALLALAGCAADPAAPGPSYATLPRLRLEPGPLLCGGARTDGCDFVDVAAAAVGPDGRVALAGVGGDVAHFDAEGRFVRRVGRSGAGPGEYRAAMALAYDSAATLTVLDAADWRLVRFDSTGTALDARRVVPPAAVQDAAFAGERLAFLALPGAAAIGDTVTARFLGVDARGEATVPLGETATHAVATGDGALVPVAPPFAARPRWSAGPDGAIYFADGTGLRIVRADADGAGVVLALEAEGPAVTEAELDSARAVLLRVRDGAPTVRSPMREQAEAALSRAARRHPMIRALVAVDGGLWARESRASAPDSVRWNGFDATGRPRGRLLLPVRARILAGGRGRLLVATYDADDVPSVRWYTVRAAE